MSDPRRPALLVAIDTEGDNQWDARARANQTFENLYALGRLHAFFERHDVRPTYVITHPVATEPRSADVLRGLLARGGTEIGAHHHAWETPPFGPDEVRRHAYALSLPPSRFDAQLASLTAAIERAVGVKPVSYRSGRFGFAAAHVSSLERAGYLIDSSVAPLFYEAHKQGPDFVGAPLTPYFLAYDDATRPGTSDVLELPISAALNRRLPAAVERWSRQIVDRGAPMLNLLFHSSEAIVGGSPYNRTQGELDAFFERLGRALTYATKDLAAEPMTFAAFRASHLHLRRATDRASA
jgi:hypothetical protein